MKTFIKKNKKEIVKSLEKIFFAQESTGINFPVNLKSISKNPTDVSAVTPQELPVDDITEIQKNWDISLIKNKISIFAEQGKLSTELSEVLAKDGYLAPVEFECLDYKENFDNTPYDRAKLIKRIVSFYNSLGGYLVFGVAEVEDETTFKIVGISADIFDFESLKSSIKDYTGERIQITPMNFSLPAFDASIKNVLFLHIPKRPNTNPPLHFLKDGPAGTNKKHVFLKDDVFCRRGDECVEAKGPRILDLNGDRPNPYAATGGAPIAALLRSIRISHNLPDRNFICPKFIGREKFVDSLWRWLGDDLSHVKVLAGEGGLGKSSIAFEFAERVSETKGAPFDQVVWLTAKEQQFNAFDDKYVRVPERHYKTYDELLSAICERLAFTPEELSGASAVEMRRLLKRGLAQIPSLIIIDDVDSLSPEEQRQVLELGMILGNSVSRLLLTTRYNQSYSSDIVIKISGFSLIEEFPNYLESLRGRLDFPILKSNDIEKIHQTSGGSPLFTESLLRLLRWNTVGEAISGWKGERGTAVRAAALRREIQLLSAESQRILFAIAMLGEVSKVELCEVLGYTSEVVDIGLHALQSLFLVAAPALADIPRFRVPDNTRRLVLDPTIQLVTDRPRLQKNIEDFRRKDDRSPTRDARIAEAISQAESLKRIGDIAAAMATIKEALRKTKDHYDLLCYQANLLIRQSPSEFDQARLIARKAYQKGCRKSELFQCWFDAEWAASHFIGALEAAEAALNHKSPSIQDWLIRKSAALASKATDQSKVGSVGVAIDTMFEASEALRNAISKNKSEDAFEWEERQATLHDQIWYWVGLEDKGLGKADAQIDALEHMWRLGDNRLTNSRRVLSAIDGMNLAVERRLSKVTASNKHLFFSLLARGRALLEQRTLRFPSDKKHETIINNWKQIELKANDTISKTSAI
jgi:tetratricopeptide (TPR) repeat protein